MCPEDLDMIALKVSCAAYQSQYLWKSDASEAAERRRNGICWLEMSPCVVVFLFKP